MDRLARWASGGSLAWLVLAVGLVLGTHGASPEDVGTAGATEARPVGECPDTPVAANASFSIDANAPT